MHSSLCLSVGLVCVLVVCLAHGECPVNCQCSALSISCKNAQLTDVPCDVLQTGVVKFDLSSNKITSLRKDSFPAVLSSVEILVLASNKISSVDVNSLGNLHHLNQLDLSGNEIRFIEPKVFSKNTNLMSLKLTNNLNLKLPEKGYNFPELVKLELELCGISKIPADFFQNMKNIQFLYLNDNEISFLEPTNFKHLTNLVELDLRDNWFKGLQRDILELHSSTKLQISKNPWNCDCGFRSALEFLERRNYNKPLICKSPKQLRGLAASKTSINDLFHCDAPSRTTLTSDEVDDDGLAGWYNDDDRVYPDDARLANLVQYKDDETSSTSHLPLVDNTSDDEEIVALFSSSEPESWMEDNQWWMICGAIVLAAIVVVAVINNQVNTRRKTHSLTNVHYNEHL